MKSIRQTVVHLLLTTVVASCGGQRKSAVNASSPSLQGDAIGQRQEAIAALESQLDAPVQMATPDCDKACSLQDRICGLAAEICVLASKVPNDTVSAASCDDSNRRCESARKRVAESCVCALKGQESIGVPVRR